MTLAFERDLHWLTVNHYAEYLGHCRVTSNENTDAHSERIALLGPLKWSAISIAYFFSLYCKFIFRSTFYWTVFKQSVSAVGQKGRNARWQRLTAKLAQTTDRMEAFRASSSLFISVLFHGRRHTGRTDRRTDRHVDGRTDGRTPYRCFSLSVTEAASVVILSNSLSLSSPILIHLPYCRRNTRPITVTITAVHISVAYHCTVWDITGHCHRRHHISSLSHQCSDIIVDWASGLCKPVPVDIIITSTTSGPSIVA